FVFFFQAEDGIRDFHVTGVQTCALPISFPHTLIPVQKISYRASFDNEAIFHQQGSIAPAGEILIVGDNDKSLIEILSQLKNQLRSEERRVGKECRSRGAPEP